MVKGRFRTEKDSLGIKQVPSSAYYGVQTARAVENFPISGRRAHPLFLKAFMYIKRAAATVNHKKKILPSPIARAITRAADEVLAGKYADQFPVDIYQMGAGTSFNMNCNEVLANRAEEILGGRKGEYRKVHSNDHVNMSQSTNDTFPTAIRIAGLMALREYMYPRLANLAKSLRKKGREFDKVLKSARTHLQDAVPIRLGQEFHAYAGSIEKCLANILEAEGDLHEIGLGGSAAGTGINTSRGFAKDVAQELRKLTGLPLRTAPDLRQAMQSQYPVARVMGELRNLAVEVNRICNDLRLLASGPMTGFNEIRLPAVAPGSSIMPGKVNPSIPEMVNMVCYQVIGCDTTVAAAVGAGQLELNVMMPVIMHNLMFSIQIFGNALEQLRVKCTDGILANKERCEYYATRTLGLATALNRYIGYSKAAEVAKEAARTGKTIIGVVRSKRYLSEKQLRKILAPKTMTEPGIPGI